MDYCKAFHTKTRGFQNKTVSLLVCMLNAALIMAFPLRSLDADTGKGPAGDSTALVLVAVDDAFVSEGEKIAKLLALGLRRRYASVELIEGHRKGKVAPGVEIRPDQAAGEIKLAWEAYYQLDFSRALRHLQKSAEPTSNSSAWGAAGSRSCTHPLCTRTS